MRTAVTLAFFSLLLTHVVADNDQGRLFRQFFQGVTEGIGFPVPYQFFIDNQVDEQDTNVPALFSGLQQLSAFNTSDILSSFSAVNTIGYWMTFFGTKRPSVVAKNSNLNETLVLVNFSALEPATFLREVIRKGYDTDLIIIGQSTPDHMVFAGQQLGLILANCFGTTVSLFLRGLGAGFGTPIDKQYLVDKKFDNSTVNMTDIASLLSLLRTNPYGPVKTVQIVLVQWNYDIQSIPRMRPSEVSSNQNLSQIFKTFLPIIFKDITNTMNVIQTNGYLDRFAQIADAIPGDVEQAGARLGFTLKLIYTKLISQESAPKPSLLKDILHLSRAAAILSDTPTNE